MMKMTVETNIKDMIGSLNALAGGIEQKATVRAMNRVIDMARTEAVRKIREKYSFPATLVRSTLITYKASPQRIEAVVRGRGRRTRLIDMQARQTRQGVTVRIGKTRKLIRHAFIATMKSGHTGVYIRTTKKRLPIKELYTISIPEGFASKTVMDALTEKVRDVFPGRLQHELDWLIRSKT